MNEPAFIIAHRKGYRVTPEGIILNPSGKPLKIQFQRKGGYPYFSVGKVLKCRVHRLQAWQKFGEAMLQPGIEVRHLDGNPANPAWDNLSLGTKSQNELDKPLESRRKAGHMTAKHDHAAIIAFYIEVRSYPKVMARFGISSPGTLHFIINKSMASQPSPPVTA